MKEHNRKSRLVSALTAAVLAAGTTLAQQPAGGTVTTGEAPATNCGIVTACTSGLKVNFNPQVCGTITAPDGSKWAVPAAVTDGPAAVNIYNDCTGPGDNPKYREQLQTVVIDPDGVEITGYIFADNYYELWVNGKFVAKDGMGMTPFNSTAVRFKAKYPITYAFKAVDWETHPGLGLEYDAYSVGDGGFIARFSDGTVTGPDWKVETFYIAPLSDPSCVKTTNGRDSTACPSQKRQGGNKATCGLSDPQSCQALHFPVPDNWMAPNFNDSQWTTATIYKAEEVTGAPGYVQYADRFQPAQFIWTRNLLLDNLVLARYLVKPPPR
ncbi:MAG: hypothetical protein A3J28_00905 [Acidobacteria bacterium RIFCSPLOWO2_12_FULL_60_22]|nr:MAG: hypothetical protein A3J28_00905 [Acidobacteria bacterium RIFCSPLOWO2_12_FULL_60_22]